MNAEEPVVWEEYPFPLASGRLAWVRLPRGTLTKADAERMAAMLVTLVVEEGT